MRVAVCFRGQLRTYKYTLENLKRYFNTINNGDVTIDYFVHTWDDNLYFPTDNHKLSDRENGSYQPADLDRNFLLENLPNLKDIVIENHKEYKAKSTTVEHWGALFYSMYAVNLLKRKYESRNNFEYDLVINTRFDLIFPLTVDFPTFEYQDNCAYTFMHLAELRNEEGFLNFDDMIFYGLSSTVDSLVRIYPNFIKPQLSKSKFNEHWMKRESWDDIPKVYKLGPGSLLSQYMDDRGMIYSDIHPRYFSVARKEVELRKLDGIKDYQTIRQLHLDFYGERQFKVIRDSFASKPHATLPDNVHKFNDLYYSGDSGLLDTTGIKFTTYGSSELEEILDVSHKVYKDTLPGNVFDDSRFIYIYPLFVALHLPWHSSLETIPKRVLDACRNHKLWIVFENLLEGDNIPSIEWISLHLTLEKLNLPARNIMFVNNNMNIEDNYTEWFSSQTDFTEQIRVKFIPYDILNIKKLIRYDRLHKNIDFDKVYNFKSNNLNECKHFLKLNRTPRNERIASNIYLMENDILKNTKLSCTEFSWDDSNPIYNYAFINQKTKEKFKKMLPLGISDKDKKNTGLIGFGDGFFDPNLPYGKNDYIDTFISIVSTPFPDRKGEMHLHCSTYNPMYNMQPIIQFGPPFALKALQDKGFKTFDKWWPETYDRIQDHNTRLFEVLKVVKSLNKLTKEELLSMYLDMKDVLIHNHNLLKETSGKFSISKGIEINGKLYTQRL